MNQSTNQPEFIHGTTNKFCLEVGKKLELLDWMLGYYPDSNVKLIGSNLKGKVQTLVLCYGPFVNIYEDLHILV